MDERQQHSKRQARREWHAWRKANYPLTANLWGICVGIAAAIVLIGAELFRRDRAVANLILMSLIAWGVWGTCSEVADLRVRAAKADRYARVLREHGVDPDAVS